MIKIDALGLVCPLPLFMLQEKEKELTENEQIVIVTDHTCATTNIKHFCDISNMNCEYKEVMNGVWEITVTKKEKNK